MRDPKKLTTPARWFYKASLGLLVLVAIGIAAGGSVGGTILLKNAGVWNGDAIQIVVLPIVVGLAAVVAVGGKAMLDRIFFGPNPPRLTDDESRTLANDAGHASEEFTKVPASNMSRRRAWPVVMVIVLGGAYFLYGELAPVFSPAARKARMEEAVRRVIQNEFPGQPRDVAVELSEESPERWNGFATIGPNRYLIKAKKETHSSLLKVEWRRAE
jgi:hypothetical protein